MFSFIETKLFSQLREDYLPDDEYAKLQAALVERPECGALIPGSGGIRVIYYAKVRDGVVFMLTIYAKNEAESIPAHILRKIKGEVDG